MEDFEPAQAEAGVAATMAVAVAGARLAARGSASRRMPQTAPHVRSILAALRPVLPRPNALDFLKSADRGHIAALVAQRDQPCRRPLAIPQRQR